MKQTIIPNLWFDTQAEEAASFYIQTFGEGSVSRITKYPEAGQEIHGKEAGSVMTVEFDIRGYQLLALNGGPHFTFTPAISFMVPCASTEEVDRLYTALMEGGEALMPLDAYPFSERYGWVKDKYGLTWQIMLNKEEGNGAIYPSLLFVGDVAGKAEEAMKLYTGVFTDSSLGEIARYGADQAPDREGSVMYGSFTLRGQRFAAMDSAHKHNFTFNEAVSLMVVCEDQEEIDRLWNVLSAVPASEQCGWLKDAYGVSWQITLVGMEEMLNSNDREKANRAMNAMLSMKKIDIAAIRAAYEG